MENLPGTLEVTHPGRYIVSAKRLKGNTTSELSLMIVRATMGKVQEWFSLWIMERDIGNSAGASTR